MLGILTLGLALTLHASFGKTDSMALLARMRSEDTSRPMFASIKARIAMDRQEAFAVVAVPKLRMFVCVPAEEARYHLLETCVWSSDTDKEDKAAALGELREWHKNTFPNTTLVPGALPPDELRAWCRA